MDLKTFFMAMSMLERERFAKRCGTSRQHITNIAYGQKPCSDRLAVAIDRESKGIVCCEPLSPSMDWAHLRRKYKATARRKAA